MTEKEFRSKLIANYVHKQLMPKKKEKVKTSKYLKMYLILCLVASISLGYAVGKFVSEQQWATLGVCIFASAAVIYSTYSAIMSEIDMQRFKYSNYIFTEFILKEFNEMDKESNNKIIDLNKKTLD